MRAVCSTIESEDTVFTPQQLPSMYDCSGNVCVGNPYLHSDGHGRVQSEFFHQRSFKLMEVTLAKVRVLMEGREWAQATLLF